MKLKHYSKGPLFLFDRGRKYEQSTESDSQFKPKGLWVSVEGEDDWPTWCRSEEFALERLEIKTSIFLTPSANILYINSMEELDAFSEEYHITLYGIQDWVDWNRVTSIFDGVIIAPYQWPARMKHSWYYGWYCASGCIWNLSAIKGVQQHELDWAL